MNILNIKSTLLVLLTTIGLNFSSLAQDSSGSTVTEEPQPMMLIDNIITFYSVQMDFSTIEVTNMDATVDTVTLPSSKISPDEKTILLDFSTCENGIYLISARRDDLLLQYSIELSN